MRYHLQLPARGRLCDSTVAPSRREPALSVAWQLDSLPKGVVKTLSSYQPSPPVDRGIPLLIVKIGHYPLHHGAVAAARSLGRLGVPVYAVIEDRFTPMRFSRYLTGSFLWPTCGAEEPGALVAGLRRNGQRLGRPAGALAPHR